MRAPTQKRSATVKLAPVAAASPREPFSYSNGLQSALGDMTGETREGLHGAPNTSTHRIHE